jgi:hypothetical protein
MAAERAGHVEPTDAGVLSKKLFLEIVVIHGAGHGIDRAILPHIYFWTVA